MNKSLLIEKVAHETGLSKSAVNRTINAILSTITQALKKSDSVTLIGFGSFGVRKRSARIGHNPKTKAPIEIKAAKVPYFRAGLHLRQSVA